MLRLERVDEIDAATLEVALVTTDEGEPMVFGRGRDKRIRGWQGPKERVSSPDFADLEIHGQNILGVREEQASQPAIKHLGGRDVFRA
jgi:hypothetical protein